MSIKVENVTKAYGRDVVLDNISLEINDGDFASILAPTGSGKTTLLRIIAGLEKPDSGKIYYDEQDVTDLPVRKREIAMVYQDFINYPSLTVYENIASPLRVSARKYTGKEIDKRVRKSAKLLNISELLAKYPEELSGGQRQRTSIARTLTKDAKYIFLDEPLVNLDYKLREELRGQLKETFRRKGGVIVYATADPLDALVLSTHVGFLHQGKILQYGKAKEVYEKPQYLNVAKYFSYPGINFWEAEPVKDENHLFLKVTERLKIDVTKFKDLLSKEKYIIGIRPNAISLEKKSEDSIPITATVELCEVVGSDTELHLSYRDLELMVLRPSVYHYGIGDEIEVFINTQRVFIFTIDSNELVVRTGGDFNGGAEV